MKTARSPHIILPRKNTAEGVSERNMKKTENRKNADLAEYAAHADDRTAVSSDMEPTDGNVRSDTEDIDSYAEEKNRVVGGTLYLVATPIGNLSDLSARALKVLSGVDFIAAEDTRNTAKLLSCFGLHKPLISYYEHNKRARGPEIAERLSAGQSCALVTDAGTPAVSDPGEDLVRLCAEKDIPVVSIPGCCAAITALTLSALPTGKFVFEGFLPTQNAERRERLAVLHGETRTMILYEAPHKLRATLADLCAEFGAERKIALCRELTKRNEETMRTELGTVCAYYETHDPRGEYVLVVSGCSPAEKAAAADWAALTPEEHVARILEEHPGMKKLDAVKAAAKERGVPRSEIYNAVMKS